MSQQTTNNGMFSSLKISARDVRVFVLSTVLLTGVFAGALDIDTQFNAGRVSHALIANSQVASIDSGICSTAKFMR